MNQYRLPSNLPPIGREYFNNNESVLIYNGTSSSSFIYASANVQIQSLKDYAQLEYVSFVQHYRNSSIEPPHFILNPPKKDQLSLDCLDLIENAVHVDFTRNSLGQVWINFNEDQTKNIQYIDLQLSRRSSCWFDSTNPAMCSIPREIALMIQIETVSGSASRIKTSLQSRYNLQFVRCNAMDLPPEKLAFLPVMFETIRIEVNDRQPLKRLEIQSGNGGHFILGQIRAYQRASISTSLTSKKFSVISFLLLIFTRYNFDFFFLSIS